MDFHWGKQKVSTKTLTKESNALCREAALAITYKQSLVFGDLSIFFSLETSQWQSSAGNFLNLKMTI